MLCNSSIVATSFLVTFGSGISKVWTTKNLAVTSQCDITKWHLRTKNILATLFKAAVETSLKNMRQSHDFEREVLNQPRCVVTSHGWVGLFKKPCRCARGAIQDLGKGGGGGGVTGPDPQDLLPSPTL